MAATVMVVEDDGGLRDALCDTLELAGYGTLAATDGGGALELLDRHRVDLVVSDIQMPRMDGHELLSRIKSVRAEVPVLLMTAFGSVDSAVRALRDGASDYLVKPFESEVLVAKVDELLPAPELRPGDIIAEDVRTREVFSLALKVAASEATVMISGESGAGKEVLFRYIHAHSPRCDGPALAINCAAIPENMLEAMLFGHEKGAFTGAHKASAGKFEQAQGGSLLLDEVSEMSLALQAKLLRVLQEKEVERLGGHRLIALNVRVLATSNRDLAAQVQRGAFREDLYYRLNVFPLRMPALRERRDDIVPLAQYLLARAAAETGQAAPALSDDASALLLRHAWPGNVRELANVMQRALIVHSGASIRAGDIHIQDASLGAQQAPDVVDGHPEGDSLGDELKARESHMIIEALRDSNGSRKQAAEKLGISPRTLRYKLARLRELGEPVP